MYGGPRDELARLSRDVDLLVIGSRGRGLAAAQLGYSAHPGLWAGMTGSARGLELYASHPASRLPGLPPPSLGGLHRGHEPFPWPA